MTIKNGNGWKTITGAIAILAVGLTAMWGMVSVHAEIPHHSGAFSRDENNLQQEYIIYRLDSLEDRSIRIEQKLDKVLSNNDKK